jgi:hypothetical protein
VFSFSGGMSKTRCDAIGDIQDQGPSVFYGVDDVE